MPSDARLATTAHHDHVALVDDIAAAAITTTTYAIAARSAEHPAAVLRVSHLPPDPEETP